jgi:hypothetical protein
MTLATEALAALRDGNPHDRKPLRLKLESGLSIEAPSARYLAEAFALPFLRETRDVFRSGAVLLVRPSGVSATPELLAPPDLTQELHTALLALPELSLAEAGRPYRDLRLFVSEAERASVDTYLRGVVAAVRTLAPKWSPPKAGAVRGPAKTPAEAKAAQRERERGEAKAAAEAWLLHYLENDAKPGARILASDLYEIAESDAFSTPTFKALREPGPRQFYAVADEILGARRYSHGARFYIVLDPSTRQGITVNLADAVIERVVSKLADEMAEEFGNDVRADIVARLRSGDRLGALTLQRDRLTATGTDGAVLDLAAHRARR